ncbi:MAG: LysM peptidoglycan-binding domain-containing protein, partial [Sedimenticola sp.]
FFNDIAKYQEALNTKNQQLEALRAQQKKDAKQSEALLAEANSRHEKSTAQLKTQITRYQTEAADTALKAQHLNNAQTGFFNDIAKYQEALNTKNQQLEALRAQQKKDAQQSEALLAEANSRHKKDTSQIKKLKSAAAESTLRAQQLDAAQTGFFNDIAQYTKEINDKNQQLEAVSANLKKAEAQQKRDTEQRDLQLQNIERLQKDLITAKYNLTVFREERDHLYQKVSVTSSELNQIRNRASELNGQYRLMLNKHAKLTDDDAAKRAALNDMRLTLEDTQNEVARLTGARGIYTIQAGDSLSSIAAFFYRDGNQWSNIWKANKYMLPKPDLLYAGMVLIVPQI